MKVWCISIKNKPTKLCFHFLELICGKDNNIKCIEHDFQLFNSQRCEFCIIGMLWWRNSSQNNITMIWLLCNWKNVHICYWKEQCLSIHYCWWSLWMLFVLFEFAWKREVSAIINPAKIGLILRLPEPPESNQMVRGTFQDRFISILYVTASIPTHEIPGFMWKLKIWRYKRFDWRSWTHTTCSLIQIWFPFPFITWESAIHFLDSQNSS